MIMAVPSGFARFREAARRLPGRTPLRVKLTSALLALVAVALAVISIAGISVLKGYLLGQADSQLESYDPTPRIQDYLTGVAPSAVQPGGLALAWLPAGGRVHMVIRPGAFLGPQSSQGRILPGPAIPTSASWLTASYGTPVTVAAKSGGDRWRVVAYPHQFVFADGATITGTVIIGLNVSNIYGTIGRLIGIDLIVSLIIMLVLAVVGIALVRGSLRPLGEIERTAEGIATGDLSRRVPDLDPRTEVGRLGRSLNAMLSQVELAFRARADSETAARRSEERMRQFVADASHELRTPLTAIRGFAEYYRQRGGVENGSAGSVVMPHGQADAGSAGTDGQADAAAGTHGQADAGTPAEAGMAAAGTDGQADAAAAGTHGQADAAAGMDGQADAGTPAEAGMAAAAAAGTAGTGTAGEILASGTASRPDRGAAAPPSGGSGPLDPIDLDRIMRRVEQESTRMGVLVEDMLLLARLDQQRPLENRPVDLLMLAADAVHDARVMAPRRSIDLTVGAGAALIVIGDEVRLRQVIGNLMSNALTHTPDATGVQVRVRSGSLGEGRAGTPGGIGPGGIGPGGIGPGGIGPGEDVAATARPTVVLEVADHGSGLTPEQAERAFERFYRADQARTRRAGGTGLGLAIVAALVAAHGGNVWVEPTPGGGATFRIALPLAPEALGPGPGGESPAAPDQLTS
jgi:signal transduction histidine kinase